MIGGSARVWKDIEAALEITEADGVVAANDVAAAWPGKLDAFVSLHGEKMGMWTERRRRAGFPDPERTFAHDTLKSGVLKVPDCITDFTPWRFNGQEDSGSSGLFALKVALIDLGFDKAVLCGVPLEAASGHFFDLQPWGGAEAHRRGWRQALPAIRDRARSMSGWTQELLGEPTTEWLAA